jgi:hypothetical protein
VDTATVGTALLIVTADPVRTRHRAGDIALKIEATRELRKSWRNSYSGEGARGDIRARD